MDEALTLVFSGFAESLNAALAPLRDLAAPLRGLTVFLASSTNAMQGAGNAFRAALKSGNAGDGRGPNSAGATEGQVGRALGNFEQQLAKLPSSLGAATAAMKPELDRVAELFDKLQQSGKGMANGVNRGFVELQAALTRIGNVKSADDLSKIGDQLQTAIEKVKRAQGQAESIDLSIFGKFAAALGAASNNLASLLSNPLAALSKGVNAAAVPTAKAAGGMAGALGGIAGAVMGPLAGLAGSVGSFVQALNPALMKLFNQALRDLMATFGTAFAPVIQHISALFNELSATIAPAMRALAPIIDNLMSVLEGSLVPMIGMVADAFVALSPIIEFVTGIMANVAEAMRVVYTVFRSAIQVLYDVLKQIFGGVDLKGAAQGIQDVIRQLTKYFVQFAAYVAKALGYLDPFAKALERNLRDLEGKKPGVKAAPENVHVSGLEQISKDLAVAAYAAQAAGGTRKKSEAEFLEELIKEVEEVKHNGKTLEQFLEDMKDKLIKGVMDDLSALWDKFVQWWTQTTGQIGNIPQEAERHRRLNDQQDEMYRRGVPGINPSGRDPTFWDNLFSS